jgi:hypothetical protein
MGASTMLHGHKSLARLIISVFVYLQSAFGQTFTLDTTTTLIGGFYDDAVWGDYDNDGDLDILFVGVKDFWRNMITRIYRNDGHGKFTDVGARLVDAGFSTVDWGDYDRDGDLDFVMTGQMGSLQYTAKIYRNDGNGVFTDTNVLWPDLNTPAKAIWGDFDNDGDLDLLLSGIYYVPPNSYYATKIYRNIGKDQFVDTNISFDLMASIAEWGDYAAIWILFSRAA